MKKFKRIYIEITNVCNLKCSFCPKTLRKPQFMDLEFFKKVLEEIAPYTDYVFLHVKGEPLLHPQLEDILKECYKHKIKANITTNGTLIASRADMLVSQQSLRQINFSLHSFDDNSPGIDSSNYMKDILEFTSLALKKSNMIVALRLWNLTNNNISNIEREKNRKILSQIEEYFNIPDKIEERVTPGRGVKLADRVYLNQDPVFEWPHLDSGHICENGFCYGMKSHCAILVDGTVIPCCLDGEGVVALGNLQSESFSSIMDSERSKAIIKGFSDNKAVEELCKNCTFKERFTKGKTVIE